MGGSPEQQVRKAIEKLDALEKDVQYLDAIAHESVSAASRVSLDEARQLMQTAPKKVLDCKTELLSAYGILESLMRAGSLPPQAMSLGPRTVNLNERIGKAQEQSLRLQKLVHQRT